jgi:hypothetical protein
LDYEETFNTVFKPVKTSLLLSLAMARGWHLHQLNIQNAFLNDVLDEHVFMKQPRSFIDPAKPSHYCGLISRCMAWSKYLAPGMLGVALFLALLGSVLHLLIHQFINWFTWMILLFSAPLLLLFHAVLLR